MPPELEALLILTRRQFPALAEVECEVEEIVKGGSDRRFYRFTWSGGVHAPMVLMIYTLARRDNPKFVPATHRLAALGVHVPKIYAFDEQRLCVWLEDLGRDDLHAHREAGWGERLPLYQAALREGAKMHAVTEDSLEPSEVAGLEIAFDEALYEWEQNYFLEHFVRQFLRRETHEERHGTAHEALLRLRQRLGWLPRCLVHRDFQSQNILLREGSAWLVDYQGLRLGLAEYDIASLLFDPYVPMREGERQECLDFYAELRGLPAAHLREVVYLCAAQRLMQALGAYANLSRNQGKHHFEQHIPAGVRNLRTVCEAAPELGPIQAFLD